MGLHIPPALHHRRFRLLWTGMLISLAGSQMQLAALHWHIRDLTGTPKPLALGGIGLARILPVILFSLVGGAVADTMNRRRVLFLTQAAMAAVAVALAVLTFTGHISLWHIYGLTALQAVAVAFDLPARQAMVPSLVPGHDLPSAFSLQSIAFNTGAVLGPALGGFVIASWGLAYAYLFNAVSFLAVIAALALMGPVAQRTDPEKKVRVDLASIREGLTFILSKPIILSTMLLDFFATFFASANTMMPILARDILKVNEIGYGLLSSAQSMGAAAAALVVSQLRTVRRQGPGLLLAVVVYGLATILFGLTRVFIVAMAALALAGAADAVSTIIRNTIRQLRTPDHIRGRMTSVNQVFFMGGPQLGEVEAGIAAQLAGVPFAIITGGIGTILAAALIVRKWPLLLRYDGHEPADGPEAGGQPAAAGPSPRP